MGIGWDEKKKTGGQCSISNIPCNIIAAYGCRGAVVLTRTSGRGVFSEPFESLP